LDTQHGKGAGLDMSDLAASTASTAPPEVELPSLKGAPAPAILSKPAEEEDATAATTTSGSSQASKKKFAFEMPDYIKNFSFGNASRAKPMLVATVSSVDGCDGGVATEKKHIGLSTSASTLVTAAAAESMPASSLPLKRERPVDNAIHGLSEAVPDQQALSKRRKSIRRASILKQPLSTVPKKNEPLLNESDELLISPIKQKAVSVNGNVAPAIAEAVEDEDWDEDMDMDCSDDQSQPSSAVVSERYESLPESAQSVAQLQSAVASKPDAIRVVSQNRPQQQQKTLSLPDDRNENNSSLSMSVSQVNATDASADSAADRLASEAVKAAKASIQDPLDSTNDESDADFSGLGASHASGNGSFNFSTKAPAPTGFASSFSFGPVEHKPPAVPVNSLLGHPLHTTGGTNASLLAPANAKQSAGVHTSRDSDSDLKDLADTLVLQDMPHGSGNDSSNAFAQKVVDSKNLHALQKQPMHVHSQISQQGSMPVHGGLPPSNGAFAVSSATADGAEVKTGSPFDALARLDSQEIIVVGNRRYLRLDCIGKGGSSRVYRVLGEDMSIHALKRVRLARMDAASVCNYTNEISLLKKLAGHRHIIRLFGAEVSYEQRCIHMVMEYGQIDLNKLLQDERERAQHPGGQKKPGASAAVVTPHPQGQLQFQLDENLLRLVWQQMLISVQTIHDARIVHGDLKPANFVFVEGVLKLIDFGIAKAINNDTTNIVRESQVGTLNYMSPEAILDVNGPSSHGGMSSAGPMLKVGRASDIWSLGCILYQMVYGRTPFADLPLIQKLQAIIDPRHKIQFPPIRDVALLSVMQSCLQRDPTLRPSIAGTGGLLEHPFLRPHLAANEASASRLGPTLPPDHVAASLSLLETIMTGFASELSKIQMLTGDMDQHTSVSIARSVAARAFEELAALSVLTTAAAPSQTSVAEQKAKLAHFPECIRDAVQNSASSVLRRQRRDAYQATKSPGRSLGASSHGAVQIHSQENQSADVAVMMPPPPPRAPHATQLHANATRPLQQHSASSHGHLQKMSMQTHAPAEADKENSSMQRFNAGMGEKIHFAHGNASSSGTKTNASTLDY
jgi:serine/threonine protein kinase